MMPCQRPVLSQCSHFLREVAFAVDRTGQYDCVAALGGYGHLDPQLLRLESRSQTARG